VPHLSNQTYELEILVLNVQSYPTVGGLWEVMFNTTGMSNLTLASISNASLSTSYSEVELDNGSTIDDLVLEQVTCGDEPVFTRENGPSVLYYEGTNNIPLSITIGEGIPVDGLTIVDWNCSDTASLVVQVLTAGVHVQSLTFGDHTVMVYNSATSPNDDDSGSSSNEDSDVNVTNTNVTDYNDSGPTRIEWHRSDAINESNESINVSDMNVTNASTFNATRPEETDQPSSLIPSKDSNDKSSENELIDSKPIDSKPIISHAYVFLLLLILILAVAWYTTLKLKKPKKVHRKTHRKRKKSH